MWSTIDSGRKSVSYTTCKDANYDNINTYINNHTQLKICRISANPVTFSKNYCIDICALQISPQTTLTIIILILVCLSVTRRSMEAIQPALKVSFSASLNLDVTAY